MLLKFLDKKPKLDGSVFIADGAKIIGDVTLHKNSSIWFNAVLRGDVSQIVIGENSNVQDNSTIHTDHNKPVILGKNVTIGHNCILHSCVVEDNTLIGMGSTILDCAVIGKGSIVGANSLVTGRTIIPPNSLVLGSPAKVVKELNSSEQNIMSAKEYVEISKKYK